MFQRLLGFVGMIAWIMWTTAVPTPSLGQDDPIVAEISAVSKKFAEAFNAGKVDDAVSVFLEQGELIDEEGVVYQGREEIKQLITAFLERFPEAKIGEEVESIRRVGPVAVKEGVRTMASKDGSSISRIRFITTYAQSTDGWQVVSVRDFGDETPPTSGELLQPLDWMIGEWVNEGADGRVKITYRWSDDKNFILGEFRIKDGEGNEAQSSQRIGWDPRTQKPHSWLFDSDGGFAEGTWTQTENGWLVNSSAVMPDGLTGSAVLKLMPGENGRFVIAGTNRIVGDQLEDDFELTVVKQPPAANK